MSKNEVEMKKYILTEQIIKYNLYQKLCNYSPIIFTILSIPSVIYGLYTLKKYNNPQLNTVFLALVIVSIITMSIIAIFIGTTYLKYKRLDITKNATFESISGLEYHRDKLDGLSPVEISYLTDLELEEDKDIAAQILQYELWGVIEFVNGKINIKNINDSRLKERDKILIKLLANDATDLSQWKKQSYNDMTNSKFFYESKDGKSKLLKITYRLAYISLIFFIIFFILFLITSLRNLENLDNFTYIFDYFINMENNDLSNFIITNNEMYIVIAFMLLAGIIFGSFIAGIGVARFDYVNNVNKSKLIRTNEGNRTTEYIFGLKNFINDFTLLSEREKKELVLWDDFLIYAVVLEENKKIIDEIFSYRNEKKYESTLNKIKKYF